MHKTSYEQKGSPFSNVQLYDSAQTQNVFRFKITSILYEKEINCSNSMCLDYHNEVKKRFTFSINLRREKFCIFQGLIQGTFRSKVDNTAPRPRSQ